VRVAVVEFTRHLPREPKHELQALGLAFRRGRPQSCGGRLHVLLLWLAFAGGLVQQPPQLRLRAVVFGLGRQQRALQVSNTLRLVAGR
jgi:hypothetical protein